MKDQSLLLLCVVIDWVLCPAEKFVFLNFQNVFSSHFTTGVDNFQEKWPYTGVAGCNVQTLLTIIP